MGGDARATGIYAASALVGAATGNPWAGFGVSLALNFLIPPKKPPKPTLHTELLLNSSQGDVPIPILYGTRRIESCNYIYKGTPIAIARKESQGGASGGTKVVTGYDYYMDALIGICQGEVYVSRLWQNNDINMCRGKSTMTIYNGTDDQTTDPMFGAAVDNAVPYRGLAYLSTDQEPIGSDNRVPTYFPEAHRYPFNSNAGDTARIYSHRAHMELGDGDMGLMSMDSEGNVWMIDERDNANAVFNKIYKYNSDLSTKDGEVDITELNTPHPIRHIMDFHILEEGDRVSAYILCIEFSGNRDHLCLVKITDLNKFYSEGPILEIGDDMWGDSSNANFSSVEIYEAGSGAKFIEFATMVYDDNFLYIGAVDQDRTPHDKFIWTYNTSLTEVTETDMTSDMTGDSFAMAVIGDYIFTIDDNGPSTRAYTFDIATMTEQDSFALSNVSDYTYISRHSADFLRGGDEVIVGGRGSAGGSYNDTKLFIFGVDLDDGSITHRKTIELYADAYWDSDLPSSGLTSNNAYWPLDEAPVVRWAPDGSIMISYFYNPNYVSGYWQFRGLQILETSLNPAQMIYDIVVNQNEINAAYLDTTQLQDVSDFCFDNYIGVSDVIARPEAGLQRVQSVMQMLQGVCYRNDDGQISFNVYRDTDTSQATITADELLFTKNGNKVQEGVIELTLSDPYKLPNRIIGKYFDRTKDYKEESFTIDHFLGQTQDDRITTTEAEFYMITHRKTAVKLAYRYLKYARYADTLYAVPLVGKYMYLNPGDVITLNIADQDLNDQKVRIMEMEEPPLDIDAYAVAICRREETWLNTYENFDIAPDLSVAVRVSPPASVRPVIFEPHAIYTNDQYQLNVAAYRGTSDTIGCEVWATDESGNYVHRGDIFLFAPVGLIQTAVGDSDETDRTIRVNTGHYPDTFPTKTHDEQLLGHSDCLVGTLQDGDCEMTNLEYITYRESTASGDDFNLENCYRGKYFTVPKTHAVTEHVMLVGVGRFLEVPIPGTMVGKTINLKFVAYNARGQRENFDSAKTWSYTVRGYTRKATHVTQLELVSGGVGRGSCSRVNNNDVAIQWAQPCRFAGLESVAFGELTAGTFDNDDIENYDLLVYNSSGTLVATRTDIGDVTTYTYTSAMNAADFGVLTKNLYLGVRPKNSRGFVADVVKIPITITT